MAINEVDRGLGRTLRIIGKKLTLPFKRTSSGEQDLNLHPRNNREIIGEADGSLDELQRNFPPGTPVEIRFHDGRSIARLREDL